jgi:hypothetical protein
MSSSTGRGGGLVGAVAVVAAEESGLAGGARDSMQPQLWRSVIPGAKRKSVAVVRGRPGFRPVAAKQMP